MRAILFVSLVLVVVAGCTFTAEAPPPQIDLAAERASLLEADRAWAAAYAASESPADAFVANLLDDARLLAPDTPLAEGKGAIREIIAGLESMPGFRVTWGPAQAEVAASGDLGYTRGAYEMRMEGPDGVPIRIVGKYLTVWNKQENGSWKVAVDMFNADGPPALVEG